MMMQSRERQTFDFLELRMHTDLTVAKLKALTRGRENSLIESETEQDFLWQWKGELNG